MSTVIAAPQTGVAQPSRWLRIYLIVIAIVEGLEGIGKIPILFSGDAEVPGPGWSGWAVTSELALTLPFALVALFFLVKRDVRRAIPALAGIGLVKWISYLPSLAIHPAEFPGPGFMGVFMAMQMTVFPLLMLMAIALCWKNQRLALAGILASVPTIAHWLGVVAFGIGVAIYGF